MKTLCSLALITLLCIPAPSARAGFDDIGFTCVAKKVDENLKSAGTESRKNNSGDEVGGVVAKAEHWSYSVSLENRAFNPLTDLEVKYMVFYKQEQLGAKGPPREQCEKGSSTIKSIDPHGKQAFETVPVELKKSHLMGPAGGYTYFSNGANSKAEDSLAGIWIRVYQGGKMIGEFIKPPNISSREKWAE